MNTNYSILATTLGYEFNNENKCKPSMTPEKLLQEYELIQQKKSNLSSSQRKYIVQKVNEWRKQNEH